ncbi:unnamed protein product [Macrosiphum euphorbiae]|uniref:Uncharacterized protein n=1 Tax=Macrosiphum euphorbiae TaxID=13131 RepID=A0AAV0W7I0_9HEMI|nr:unnamed protein product [Macrosiphum euphorbiae]
MIHGVQVSSPCFYSSRSPSTSQLCHFSAPYFSGEGQNEAEVEGRMGRLSAIPFHCIDPSSHEHPACKQTTSWWLWL